MVEACTHGRENNSWYRFELKVLIWTHHIDLDSWCIPGHMLLTLTYGIVSLFLNYTQTKGLSVACMQDFK